jgi:hypothetical protein
LFELLGGMNPAMDTVLHDFGVQELQTIAAFLSRTVDAGRTPSEELSFGT